MSHSAKAGITLDTPIDRIILMVARRLQLDDGYDYKFERWIKLLKDNWISCVRTLIRVPPSQLAALNLPIALKLELDEICGLGSKVPVQSAHFYLQDEVKGSRKVNQQLQLTEREKDLVHSSFRQLLRYKDAKRFQAEFFPHFFAIHPGAKRLFNQEKMNKQSKAFVQMVYWIVENMDTQNLGSVLNQLGGRHAIYQVMEDEYGLMAQALVQTFTNILGDTVLNAETQKAWREVISQFSQHMIAAGVECARGYRDQLRRQKNTGAWEVCYTNLLLDAVLLYKDKALKNLICQYPLKGIPFVAFPKDDNDKQKYVFQLNSLDPPFSVKFCCDSQAEMDACVAEYEWRINAIQRMMNNSSSPNSSAVSHLDASEDDATGDVTKSEMTRETNQPTRSIKSRREEKKLAKTEKLLNVELDVVILEKQLAEKVKGGLNLTDTQNALLKQSWSQLLLKKKEDNGVTKSGIGILFEEFYESFFQQNPAGRRLFENSGLQVQGRALVSMIGLIIRALDNFDQLSRVILQLGGRHQIYGVTAADYECFGRLLSKTISRVYGENMVAVETAWFSCFTEVASFMLLAQKILPLQSLSYLVYRKTRASGSWKQSVLKVHHDYLYIFANKEATKLASSIAMKQIRDIARADQGDPAFENSPGQIGFYITLENGDKNERECDDLMDGINWRTQANLRVYKYDESELEKESSGNKDSADKKEKKQKKYYISRKREKRDKEKSTRTH